MRFGCETVVMISLNSYVYVMNVLTKVANTRKRSVDIKEGEKSQVLITSYRIQIHVKFDITPEDIL